LEILTAEPVRGANMHQSAKFRVDYVNRCRDMTVFKFSKWRKSAILDFEKFEILPTGPIANTNMRLRATFVADRSNVCGDMADLRVFKMAAVRHIGFVLRVFATATKSICWFLSLCKIWLESVQ